MSSASRDAYLSSGSSPTLSLVGAGKVGRAFLGLADLGRYRLRSASDRSGTICDADRLDPRAVAARKLRDGRLRTDGDKVDLDLALSLVEADAVVDTTDSDLDEADEAVARSLAVLDRGQVLVAACKAALWAAGDELLAPGRRERYGIDAVLGGTGRALARELDELRAGTAAIVAVPNATTTCLIEVLERGGTHAEGLALARERGLLEADPTQDVDGRDAALKLATVARLVLRADVDWRDVERPDLFAIEPGLLADRAARGRTTRLVARCDPDGPRLAYEELPRNASLAIPSRHVLYAYDDAQGRRRLHLGLGVGPEATARALLGDLDALLGAGEGDR
ncbi:MAG: hypothetical protein R3F30_15540 [Planctomycetota bacterium]